MTTQEYLEQTNNERIFVVGYITDAGGGIQFNSVDDQGQEVQYYGPDELEAFSEYKILDGDKLQGMIEAGEIGESNKFVATVATMKKLGRL